MKQQLDAFFKHSITLNILFCISYFSLAVLGFKWGALTTTATLLWPPSGLAVFGALVFGRRAIPGLLIGAIISSQLLSQSNSISSFFSSLGIASVSGASSILQAMIIARYARHYFKNKFRVSTIAGLSFTLLVMVGCVIAATISNLMLWQAGIINIATALQNWAVWWLGDTIGVLIVAPLLLWFYQNQTRSQNSQANAFFIFCAGAGIVLLTVAAIGHNERETYRKNVINEAENLRNNMQANLDLATRDISTLKDYFLRNTPDQTLFRNLTEPLLRRNLWLDSFSWMPSANRDQKNTIANLAIDYDASLSLVRLSEDNFDWKKADSETFSKAFLTKISKNLTPNHSDIFLRDEVNLHQTKTSIKSPHINLVEPIYFCNSGKKECRVFNLISSELDLNSLMRSAIAKNRLADIDIQLTIATENQEQSSWVWDQNHWNQTRTQPANDFKAAILIKDKKPTLKVFSSEWQLSLSQKNIAIWFLPSLLQWSVLIIGFAMVSLLSAYLQALYRQDQLIIENQTKLKDEIESQTKALRIANDWLLKEIEERRNTQEQLKASEAHMRTLLDNIPDPIWFKSNEGVYLSFNKAVTELFHRKDEEVIGKKASDFTDPEFDAMLRDFENAALQSEKAVRKDLHMYIPSKNEKRLMDTIKVAMRDEHNHPIGILSIARDVTEQHLLIDELEKFKRFAEYASEGFAIMTLSAETLYMNRSMQKMLLSNNRVSHNNFLQYFPIDLHAQWQNQILPYVLLNGYWQGELAALRTDHSRFPTKETFFIIRDDKGQPMFLGEVMSDISEQKQVEASLQLAKDAAEEATRAKSRFLANMSHEIRTPLNAVLGYSQLLIADPQLSTQQHERMNSILNAGQRLLHLINDILDLSKIEAGALHFRQDYFDLRQELNDIISLMRTKAITKGLSLEFDIQLPTPAIVKSDRQKIGQIILNLLGNAIKFTTLGKVCLNVSLDSKGILFNVIDTGSGISAQELQSLFSAFKQGKSGEESGGTGLGLVISKHIAESLGGEIVLDSEVNKGTHAHLRLPLMIEYNTQLNASPQMAQTKLAENSHCQVLVIEDDPASRDILVNLLQTIGCDVREAVNGKEGLAAALNQKPDIIFTDIRMPELSGTDMLKELRQHISKDDLPVIAVSASSLEHERTFYLGEGFHEFIGKPYNFRDIYSTLTQFTHAEFVHSENAADIEVTLEKIDWKNLPEHNHLLEQLTHLKNALNSGDMNNSKKLFAQQSAHSIGREAHQRLQNAMRQYDLVLAEKFLDDLLDEIKSALN